MTDAAEPGRKAPNKKRWVVLAAAGAVLLLAALFAVYADLQEFARTSASPGADERYLTFEPGRSLAAWADELRRHGLVSSAFKFRLLARLEGFDRRLKAGEYALRASMSPREILNIMAKGAVRMHRLTVPEGLTISQLADVIEKAGLVRASEIVARATDPAFARLQAINAQTLEGYLFPETYFFPRTVTADGIITAMLQGFRSVFTADWERRALELGFSVHEAVTLASIIEKETGEASERPVIASVFHNRLKRGMRLETDPTVIYGIKNFDGNLTRWHLETPTPYNTYIIKGLPPGPIANPGKEALRAALFPARTDFLFFVSKNNGTHQFSTNFADHQRAVQHYQLGPGRASAARGKTHD